MRLEKFFDPSAIFQKLILKRKKHFNQAQGEHTFGVSGRFAATELGGIGEEVPFVVDRCRFAKDGDYVRTFPTDACRPSPRAGVLGSAVKTSKPTLPPSLRRLPKPSDSTQIGRAH